MYKLTLCLLIATLFMGSACDAQVTDDEMYSALLNEEGTCPQETAGESSISDRQLRKEEKRRQKAERRQERKIRNSCEGKKQCKIERKDQCRIKKQHALERAACKNLARKTKKMQYKESCKAQRACEDKAYAMATEQKCQEIDQKYDTVRCMREDRYEKIEHWESMRQDAVCQNWADGKYADLYKIPAWPVHVLWFHNDNFLTVNAQYTYATDCFNSSGGGSKSNITKLAFGDNPIKIQDILLVSKLASQGKVVQSDPNMASTFIRPSDQYLGYLANEVVRLIGRQEKYGLSLDFSRYVISNNVAIGCQIPVLYNRNRLKLSTDLPAEALVTNAAQTVGATGVSGPVAPTASPAINFLGAPNTFLRRYGADPERFIQDILTAKGISELGGSAAGLGDISAFINFQIDSVMFDKLVFGLRGQFPTGKKATARKLWAPELGNGGFTEVTLFGSMLVSYSKYINPHILLQTSYNAPAHVDRRVPKRVVVTVADNAANVAAINAEIAKLPAGQAQDAAKEAATAFDTGADAVAAALAVAGINAADATAGYIPVYNAVQKTAFPASLNIPMQDRVHPNRVTVFNEYDTTIKNFGDTISNVKLTKGVELKFRIGNMIERFIWRRGFLDIFYDFRAKAKDKASGLQTDVFNVDVLRQNTQELEHRIGFDFSYQCDMDARLHAGMRYTFAGKNVPKAFEFICCAQYSF